MQTRQAGEGGAHRLVPHPARPPLAVSAMEARVRRGEGPWLTLRWRIEGARRLVVPAFGGRGRADGLWRTTCFELFVQPAGATSYVEFNLSPSEGWAAYEFDAPREGMRERAVPRDPVCTMRRGGQIAIFDAAIPMDALPAGSCTLGLTAVIEEEGGALSYWALAHGADQPDFHDPACFTATLPAPRPR
jgi:hypothetical protein